MTDQENDFLPNETEMVESELCERRNFLVGLGKWSKAVIGGVLLGGLLAPGRDAEAVGWANRDGGKGSWVNFPGGWGPGWYNRRPGGWYNRRPGWYNRRPGGWYNRRPGWYNGPGWGGSWFNR
ncbi:MAG: hypothetical protein KDJ31_04235 [Candidatus Competibacteraceae bacterium]|nr:hypothetical protein [Candidatus Competibacteraceae bacterium]